jgi:putative addiction module component (TIGR02574 family)
MSLIEVKAAALELPLEERAELAKALLLSVDSPSETELEALWGAELQRRVDAVERGEMRVIDGKEAFARARAALHREFHRSRARGIPQYRMNA